ncbi:MAG: hypothetical protein IT240_00150 [Bacteroidia bacterium]|nr:hypothetical protein [Bacteroidia bacterium]MCC6767428.1 hypothetical protein [Bacteroidia bacterium]
MRQTSSKNLTAIASIITMLAIAFLPSMVNAQDIIELRDGKKIEARVVEVLKKEIVYKKFSNEKGPNYRVSTSDVNQITFESGAVDYFNKSDKAAAGDDGQVNSLLFGMIPKVTESNLGSNVVSMNITDLVVQNVTVSYERLLGEHRKVGLRVPVSVSLLGTSTSANTVFSQHNLYYSGLDLSIYPFGQGQAKFLFGPTIRVGTTRKKHNEQFIGYDTTWVDGNPVPEAIYEHKLTLHPYVSFMVHGGFNWNPIRELSVIMLAGVGSRRYFQSGPDNYDIVPTAFFNFSVGYRF